MTSKEFLRAWETVGVSSSSAFGNRSRRRKRRRSLHEAVRTVVEPLENRVLLSFTLSAAAVSTSEIDLTYSSNSGQTLELEQLGPADLNYQLVSGFSPNYNSGSHTYAVTSLSSSSHYSFRLRAAQNGALSYVTAAGDTAASSGGGTLAVPTNVVAGTSSNTVKFNWNPNADSGAQNGFFVVIRMVLDPGIDRFGLNNYTVPAGQQYEPNNGNTTYTGTINSSNNATGSYQVQVSIQDFNGQTSPLSTVALVNYTGATAPTAPTNFAVSAGQTNTTFSWSGGSGTNFSGFMVYGITSSNTVVTLGTTGSSTRSLTIANSSMPSTVVQAFVVAETSTFPVAYSQYSNIAAVRVNSLSVPAAPANLAATLALSSGHAVANLIWDNTSDAELGYYVQRQLHSNPGSWATIATLAADQDSYADTIPDVSKIYDYQIIAFNNKGNSSASNTVTVSCLPTVTLGSIPSATEGSGMTLTSTTSPAISGDSLSYAWSIFDQNGNPYTPSGVALNQSSLTFTPIDSGNWSVSLKATDSTISSGSQIASTTINSGNIPVAVLPPTVTISGSSSYSAGPGGYRLNVSAVYPSNDPDGDSISSWTVNWGDGVPGNPDIVTYTNIVDHIYHPYTTPNPNVTITASATDDDGTYAANLISLTVTPSVSDLSATADTHGAINVRWVYFWPGGHFDIQRSTDGATFTTISSMSADSSTNELLYTDTSGQANTHYYYRIHGTDSAGYNFYTNIASATTAAPGTYGAAPLDTIVVPVDGSSVVSNVTLLAGVHYLLQASGAFFLGGDIGRADAEYSYSPYNNTVIADDANVNYGVDINDTSNDLNKSTWWGPYNTSHVYTIDFIGTGQQLSFNLHDDNYSDNVQDNNPSPLEVQIFAEYPAAPSNLTAQYSVASQQVNLSWTDNAATETGFRIERSTDGQNFSLLQTLNSPSSGIGGTVTAADATAVLGQKYWYRVFAIGPSGFDPNAPSNVAVLSLAGPTVTLGSVPSAAEGSSMTLTSTATAANSSDTLAYAWSIFDAGTLYTPSGVALNQSSLTFTPNDPGNWWATLAVTETQTGATTTASTGTFAVANLPPTVSISGASTVAQSVAYTLSLSAVYPSNDPDGDSISSWQIDWGDGTSSNPDVQTVSGNPSSVTHVYQVQPASGVITATATDDDGTYAANPLHIQVTAPPAVTIVGAPSTSPEGTAITLTGTTSNFPTAPSFLWSVTKDGQAYTSGLGPTNQGSFTFTPNDDGVYVVTLVGTAGSVQASNSQTINVTMVAPTASIIGLTQTITEGNTVYLAAQASDPSSVDAATLQYAWTVTANGNAFASGTAQSFSFTPTDGSVYDVSLTVTDPDGQSTTVTGSTQPIPKAPMTLIAETVASDTINLRWQDESHIEDYYKIEASSDNGNTYAQLGTASVDITHFLATGLNPGTRYLFRVTGIRNGQGTNIATAIASTDPAALTGLTATAVANSDSQIHLTWNAPSGSINPNIEAIQVEYRSNEDFNYTQLQPFSPTTTSTTLTNLDPNTVYYFRIRAWTTPGAYHGPDYLGNNDSVNLSPYSALATATTNNVLPTAPTNVTASATGLPGQIHVTWSGDSTYADGFNVRVSTDGGQSFDPPVVTPGPTTSMVDLNWWDPRQSYVVEVSAFNKVGESTSTVSGSVTPTAMGAVGSLQASPVSNHQIQLSWAYTPAPSSNSYFPTFIIQASVEGGPFATIWTTNGTSYNDINLTAGTSYTYRVQAQYNGGFSDYSASATAITTNALPLDLSNPSLSDTLSFGVLSFGYTAPTDLNRDGINVEISTDGVNYAPATLPVSFFGAPNSIVGLEPGTTYYVRAYAYNSVGRSDYLYFNPVATHAVTSPTMISASTPTASIGYPQANSNTQLALQWNYSPTPGTSEPQSFEIQQLAQGDSDYHDAGTLQNFNPSNNIVTTLIKNLTPGVSYQYRVRAVYADYYKTNWSDASAPVSTTALLPSMPSNLSATPSGSTQAIFNWNSSSLVTDAFSVQISSDGTNFTDAGTTLFVPNASTFGIPVQGLAPSTTYFLRVQAFNSVGVSGWTDAVSVTTGPASSGNAPIVPVAPSATTLDSAIAVNPGEIDLQWTSVDRATAYLAEISSDDTTFTPIGQTSGTSYAARGLTISTHYFFRVIASNAGGDAPPSNVLDATTPPYAAPANLTATPVSQTQISLAWTETNTDESGFRVEESTDGLTYAPVNQVSHPPTTTPSDMRAYLVQGLNPGQLYYFRVRTVGPGNAYVSDVSNVASAAPFAVAQAAQPTGLTVTVLSNSEIRVRWNDNANNEDHYSVVLYWNGGLDIPNETDGSEENTIYDMREVASDVNDVVIDDLQGDTLYEARVHATNYAGASVVSDMVEVQTLPDPPTGLAAVATSPTTVHVSWNQVLSSSGYHLQRSLDGQNWTSVGPATITDTSYDDTNVGANYLYRISTTMPDGDSPFSAAAAISEPSITDFSANNVTTSEIDLAWTPLSSASSYEIERSTGNNFMWTLLATVDGSASSYADTNLITGTSYYYRIRARNAIASSAYTNISAITMLPTPINLAGSVSATSASLSWISSESAVTYLIQQQINGIWQTVSSVFNTNQATFGGSFAPSTVYNFRVSARSGGASSDFSDSLAVTSPDFAPTPSGFTASNPSFTSIDLSWAASAGAQDQFILERSSNGGAFSTIAVLDGSTSAFTDSGLADGTSYTYRLSASNSAGRSGFTVLSATTALDVPIHFAASSVTSSAITLTWQAANANAAYNLFQSTDDITWQPLSQQSQFARSFVVTGAYPPGTPYYFRIQASLSGMLSATVDLSGTTPAYPQKPAGISLTNVGMTGVSISWTPGSSDATQFQVQRGIFANFWQTLATVDGSVTSYFDNSVAHNTSYSYRIIAVNAFGQSIPGNSASIVTPLVAPAALAVTSVSGHETDLSWALPSEALSGLDIYRSTSASSLGTVIASIGTTDTTYSDSGPFNSNATYYYTVVAKSGSVSAASASVAVTTGNFPQTPTNVTLVNGNSEYRLNLAWSAVAGASSYTIYRRTVSTQWTFINTVDGSVQSPGYSDSGLDPGRAYEYRITASNAAGESGYSTVAALATSLIDPASPDGLTITADPNDGTVLNLTWTNHAGDQSGFEVQSAEWGATNFAMNDIYSSSVTIGPSATSYQATGLVSGQTYFFRVRAIRPDGPSDWSNEAYGITADPQQFGGQYAAAPGIVGGAPLPGPSGFLHQYVVTVNGNDVYNFVPTADVPVSGKLVFSSAPVWASSPEDAMRRALVADQSSIVLPSGDGMAPSINIPWLDPRYLRLEFLSFIGNPEGESGVDASGESDLDGATGHFRTYISYNNDYYNWTIHPCPNIDIYEYYEGTHQENGVWVPDPYTPAQLDSFTATDGNNSGNSVTASDANPVTLYIPVNYGGRVSINLSDQAIAASDGDLDDVLWDARGSNNAVISSGTFSSGPTITLDAPSEGDTITIEAGVDRSGNDKLEGTEVTRTIKVVFQKLILAWNTSEQENSQLHGFALDIGGITSTPNEVFDPTLALGNQSLTIDWGDGSPVDDGTAPHFFDDEGEYQVHISGTDPTGRQFVTSFSIDVADPAEPADPVEQASLESGALSWDSINGAVRYDIYQGADSSIGDMTYVTSVTSPGYSIPDNGGNGVFYSIVAIMPDNTQQPAGDIFASPPSTAPSNIGPAPSVPPPLFTYVGVATSAQNGAAIAALKLRYAADPSNINNLLVGIHDVTITDIGAIVDFNGSFSSIGNIKKDAAGNYVREGGYATARAWMISMAGHQRTNIQDLGNGTLTANLQDGTNVKLSKDGDWGDVLITTSAGVVTPVTFENPVRETDFRFAGPGQGAQGNIDVTDFINSVLIEEKDATGLLNPWNLKNPAAPDPKVADKKKTELAWAQEKIFNDTKARLLKLQRAGQVTYAEPGKYVGPVTPPTIDKYQAITKVVIRFVGNPATYANWSFIIIAGNQVEALNNDPQLKAYGYTFSIQWPF